MNLLILSLILLLGASGLLNYKLYDQYTQDQMNIEHERGEISKLQRDLIAARNQTQSEYDQEKQMIQSIDDKLKDKNSELDRIQDQFRALGNGDSAGNNPNTLEWDIRHQKEIISDLEKQFQALKGQESEAGNVSKLSQSQAKQQRADAENDIQNQINTQEQTLRDLQGQLNQAKHDRLTRDAIMNLQGQVNTQKNMVNGLKAQKQNLKQQWSQNINSTQTQSQAALAGLHQNERGLQDKIQTEKNHLRDLEKNYDVTKHTVNQHLNQISQIQKQRDDLKDQIDKLQTERAEHVKRLASLAPR